MTSAVLFSLQRSSAGLLVWLSDVSDEGTPLLTSLPLAELPREIYSQRDALLNDWQSLSEARELAAVWPAFWRIFWNTIPATREQASSIKPRRLTAARQVAATAAHPRAFRGTKFQPPKPSAPELQLCTWLNHDRDLDSFFSCHNFEELPVLDVQGNVVSICDNAPVTASALLAQRISIAVDALRALPEDFRRALLWQLRTRTPREFQFWLRIWRSMPEVNQGEGLALLAHLISQDIDAQHWIELATALAPTRRLIFLRLLMKTQTLRLSHGTFIQAQVMELDACAAEDWRFECYLDAVLSNLTRKVSVDYSLRGCWLVNRETSSEQQEKTIRGLLTGADCDEVPLADIARMSAVFEDYRKFWELSAWKMCGTLPGFGQVLRDTPWELLNSNTADHWMAIFSSLEWFDLSEASRAKRWQTIRSILPRWIQCLPSLPDSQREKYTRMLLSYVCAWENNEILGASLVDVHPLQQRFCQPPFAADSDGDCLLSALVVALPPARWQELVDVPDDVWLTVERACKRDNDARLIRYGMSVLAQTLPQFTVDALSSMPQRLIRSCRLLGCLEYEQRRQFLLRTSRAVWFTTDWAALAPLGACRTLLQLCVENELQSPLPRRLRDHLETRTTLSEPQIARHCRVALERLPQVILAAFDKLIWQHIDHPFNMRLRSNAASHAVRFLAGLGSDDNRKVLRRFLLAYSRGDSTAYLRHPLNLTWLARHPRINSDIWNGNTGLESQTIPGIRIVIETDPLEILMLGTYVGSCLGLGGVIGYSAVACLLDINKQVLYARDAQGRVLGRQLLAIDEADLLVCYQIYPSTADETLQKAFRDFNIAFAQALNIELFNREKHGDYYVDTILASGWWDDYAL